MTPDVEDAINPTELTVPYTGVDEPLGVMTACRPALIESISVSSTVAEIVKCTGSMTTI